MLDDEPRYAEFKAYQTGQVWVYERRQTPGGGNDYWSRSVSHPDLVLADLVKIFHPSLMPDHMFEWYMTGAYPLADGMAPLTAGGRPGRHWGRIAAAAFLLSLVIGSTWVPLGDVIRVLTGAAADQDVSAIVVETIRLPRAITAALAGAALGIAGLQMQTLFRNPLADPFALGITSGASLGVALVVLGAGYGAVTAFDNSLGLSGDAAITVAAIAGVDRRPRSRARRLVADSESDHGAHPRPDVRLRRVGGRHRARRREPAGKPAPVGAVGLRIVRRRHLAAARDSSRR